MTTKDLKTLPTEDLLKFRTDFWARGNSKFAGLVDRELRYRALDADPAASEASGTSASFAK